MVKFNRIALVVERPNNLYKVIESEKVENGITIGRLHHIYSRAMAMSVIRNEQVLMALVKDNQIVKFYNDNNQPMLKEVKIK